jgi:hypothetical protein
MRLGILKELQPKLVATLCIVIIIYYLYKRNFTNPREFATFIQNKVKEAFEPCSISNMGYCDNESSFGSTTFLPDIMRSNMASNSINNINNVKIKLEDYGDKKQEEDSDDEMIIHPKNKIINPQEENYVFEETKEDKDLEKATFAAQEDYEEEVEEYP